MLNTLRTLSIVGFQSTHPRGVRRSLLHCLSILCYFNPRTHVGCDFIYLLCQLFAEFQSTHPRGVRLQYLFSKGWYIHFNPRTHVGCDLPQLRSCCTAGISIHAPTWGATLVLSLSVRGTGFQSTHPRGVRLRWSPAYLSDTTFQSTHPRGVRPELPDRSD